MSIRNGVVRRREGAHLYRPKCSYHVLQAAGAQREVRVDKLGEVVGVLDFLPPHQRNWTSLAPSAASLRALKSTSVNMSYKCVVFYIATSFLVCGSLILFRLVWRRATTE
jgi:hypothetical protein